MASVRPETGQVLRETKTTVIESAEEKSPERKKHPPMWEFIESLSAADWNSKEYEIVLYRGSNTNRGDYCGKYYEPIDHERIRGEFGGGPFNILMKVPPGKQLRYNVDFSIAGPPKENAQIAPAATTEMGIMMTMLLEQFKMMREEMKEARGGNLGLEAVKQALALNGTVFNSAAVAATDTLQRLSGGGAAHAPNPMSEPMAMMQFLTQVKTLFAPGPTNSLQETLATLKLFKESGLMGTGGGEGKLMDRLALGLVGQLPTLTQHVAKIMDGYRQAEQAKLNTAAIQRGMQPPITVQPVQHVPQPALPPDNLLTMPAPAEAPPANGEQTPEQIAQAEQMLQEIERAIVEILSNPNTSPEDAAISSLKYIDARDPAETHPDRRNLVDQILDYGEMGLNHIFSTRPILQQIPPGERLEAFKKAFLENGRRLPAPMTMQPDPKLPPA